MLSYSGILLLVGCMWVPQIYRNTKYGYKKSPTFVFIVVTMVHLALIPLYLKGYSYNFMLWKPDKILTGSLVTLLLLSLTILYVQQSQPRFLIPKSNRDRMVDDYYRYDVSFEEEAKDSSASF